MRNMIHSLLYYRWWSVLRRSLMGGGEFDNEIFDRKVSTMVELVESGHKFKKWEWGGGDGTEPKYDHVDHRGKKRKTQGGASNLQEGPDLKQRRLSRYFSRIVDVDGGKYEGLKVDVENLKAEVAGLEKVVEKQGRRLRKYKPTMKGKFSSSQLGVLRRKKRVCEETEPRGLFNDCNPTDADNSSGECSDPTDPGLDDKNEEKGETSKEGDADNTSGECSEHADEVASVLAKMKGNFVPLHWAEKGQTSKKEGMVFSGSGTHVFYVTEDEVPNNQVFGAGVVVANAYPLTYVKQDSGVGSELGQDGAPVNCGTEVDFGELNKLVGVITRGAERAAAEQKVAKNKDRGSEEEVADDVEGKSGVDAEAKDEATREKNGDEKEDFLRETNEKGRVKDQTQGVSASAAIEVGVDGSDSESEDSDMSKSLNEENQEKNGEEKKGLDMETNEHGSDKAVTEAIGAADEEKKEGDDMDKNADEDKEGAEERSEDTSIEKEIAGIPDEVEEEQRDNE